MSDDAVHEIKRRLSIVDVIGRRVRLRRRGADYQGLCPFHKEKTPSFHVSPERGLYYCFGCHAGGDLVDFVQRIDRTGFRVALETLAREAGVTLPEKGSGAGSGKAALRKRLYELSETVQSRLCEELVKTPQAIAHLKGRGINGQSCKTFGLGWCPSGDEFMRWIADGNWLVDDIRRLGLLGESRSGDRTSYVRFQRRLTFPIRNASNRVIAFGGRALDMRTARYINSPESDLFSKRENLFQGPALQSGISKRDRLIVVEGYFDVISLAQHGFSEACAPLGTALGEGQLELLWRMHTAPIICFDGDPSGQSAMRRLLDRALPHLGSTRQLYFSSLPPNHDPDSYVREHGSSAFEILLASAQPASVVLRRWMDPPTPEAAREEQVAFLFRLRQSIDKVVDQTYRRALLADWRDEQDRLFNQKRLASQFRQTSRETGINQGYRKGMPAHNSTIRASGQGGMTSWTKAEKKDTGAPSLSTQRLLLAGLIQAPTLIEKNSESLAELTLSTPYDSLLKALLDAMPSSQDSTIFDRAHLIHQLQDRFGGVLKDLEDRNVVAILSADTQGLETHIDALLQSFVKHRQQQELRALAVQLGSDVSSQTGEQLEKELQWMYKNMN